MNLTSVYRRVREAEKAACEWVNRHIPRPHQFFICRTPSDLRKAEQTVANEVKHGRRRRGSRVYFILRHNLRKA